MKTPRPTVDEIAGTCIAVRLRRVNRVITNLYDDALRPLGLKISQLNILIVTARLAVARPTQVCELLQLDPSTLSRNVERMRANGWLEFLPEEDGRTHPFRLTARGLKLIARATPAWQVAQRQAQDLLGTEGIGMLDKVARNIGLRTAER